MTNRSPREKGNIPDIFGRMTRPISAVTLSLVVLLLMSTSLPAGIRRLTRYLEGVEKGYRTGIVTENISERKEL